ncbi:DUF805 domain-containing protein [Flavobacteriales bacterium]|nr:DUF805 domain-containing protein [Flavobacteriales bacterium]
MEWFLKVVRDNYSNFSGRARRKEYWMFILFSIVFSIGLSIFDEIFGLTYGETYSSNESGFTYTYSTEGGILSSLFSLLLLIPNLAVSVRRLHDVNKSGWMLLVAFIPLVGIIWLIVLFATEGDKGSNQYGRDPKKGNGAPLNNDILDSDFLLED